MKVIVTTIVRFLMTLIGSLLGPLESIVLSELPGLTGFNNMVVGFINWLSNFVVWAFSWLPFSTGFYTMLFLYFSFTLTIPLIVHTLKLIIQWWHALAP